MHAVCVQVCTLAYSLSHTTTAYKCPDFAQRRTMLDYARLRFREEKPDPRDVKRIERLIKDGEAEIASMEYYHKGISTLPYYVNLLFV